MTSKVIQLLQAAYLAQGAIERIHDLTSLQTAGQALVHYASVLAEATPEDHQRAMEHLGPQEGPPPTLLALVHRYLAAWVESYARTHGKHLPEAS